MNDTSHTRKDYYVLAELVKVLRDTGVLDHHVHSRWRVYPQDVTLNVQVTAGIPANTFGSWALVIPINVVPFPFEIIGIVVEQVSVATTFFIQVGYNPGNVEPQANMEMGERRVRLVTVPIARATEVLEIHSQDIPAKSSVWVRLKTTTGAADTVNISLVLSRHIEITHPIPLWPAFPW